MASIMTNPGRHVGLLSLHPELRVLIFSFAFANSPKDVLALSTTCQSFYKTFKVNDRMIVRDFINSLEPTELAMATARYLAYKATWKHVKDLNVPVPESLRHQVEYLQHITTFCATHLSRQGTQLGIPKCSITFKMAYHIQRLHSVIHPMARSLAAEAVDTTHDVRPADPTPSEVARVVKCLYIMDIVSILFPRSPDGEDEEDMAFSEFWQYFAPWESAQVAYLTKVIRVEVLKGKIKFQIHLDSLDIPVLSGPAMWSKITLEEEHWANTSLAWRRIVQSQTRNQHESIFEPPQRRLHAFRLLTWKGIEGIAPIYSNEPFPEDDIATLHLDHRSSSVRLRIWQGVRCWFLPMGVEPLVNEDDDDDDTQLWVVSMNDLHRIRDYDIDQDYATARTWLWEIANGSRDVTSQEYWDWHYYTSNQCWGFPWAGAHRLFWDLEHLVESTNNTFPTLDAIFETLETGMIDDEDAIAIPLQDPEGELDYYTY